MAYPKPTKATRKPTKSLSIAQAVRREMLRIAEKKVVTLATNTIAISNAGTVINLSNNITQGDDFYQRTGDKIFILNSTLRIRFQAITNNQTARFILFKDKGNLGTTPLVSEVLTGISFMANYSQLNVIQQKRFAILKDFTIDCSVTGNSVVSRSATFGRTGAVFYNGSTAVPASNGNGALFLLVIGSNSTGVYDYSWEASYNDF